jgi:uncharacterized RmlC-like cupin family protein
MPYLCRWTAIFLTAGAALFAQSRTAIENDQVRVVVVTDHPHAKTALHDHKLNRVMVYLQPGRQDIQYQDGRKVNLEWKAGEAKWSAASGMHVSEVMSESPVTIVEVEVKKPGDPAKAVKTALDPPKVAPQSYHVEFENDQVRVTRVRIGAHQSVPVHEHVLNRVVVYITDQNSRMTIANDKNLADGKVESAQHKAGEASWGAPVKHKEENVGDKPFEAVVVELKN